MEITGEQAYLLVMYLYLWIAPIYLFIYVNLMIYFILDVVYIDKKDAHPCGPLTSVGRVAAWRNG